MFFYERIESVLPFIRNQDFYLCKRYEKIWYARSPADPKIQTHSIKWFLEGKNPVVIFSINKHQEMYLEFPQLNMKKCEASWNL